MKFWFVLLSLLSLSAVSVAYLATAGLPYEPLATRDMGNGGYYVPPEAANVFVTVQLQGRGPTDHAETHGALRDLSGSIVDTDISSPSGLMLFVVLPGVYHLELAHPGWLPQTLVVSIPEVEELTLPDVTLLAGDADHDGDVDAGDLAAFRDALGQPSPAAMTTDVNNDGLTNIVDLAYSGRNIGLPGGSVLSCPGPVPGNPEAPAITGAHLTPHPGNPLIFDVDATLAGSGQMWAEFWRVDGQGPILETARTGAGDTHSLQIMRLNPSANYCFQLFAAGDDGEGGEVVGPSWAGHFRTGPLPAGLQESTFTVASGTPTYDVTLIEHNTTNFHGFLGLDDRARVVWLHEIDNPAGAITQTGNLSFVYSDGWPPRSAADASNSLKEIKPDGALLQSVNVGCEPADGKWHHEVQWEPDNTIWFLSSSIHDWNDGTAVRPQTSDVVARWNLNTGAVDELWDHAEHIPFSDRSATSNLKVGVFWRGCPHVNNAEDWTHSNSVWVADDGTVLVSMRHLHQIVATKPDFSGPAWRLGGFGGQFTFPDPRDKFYMQHSAKLLPNGHVLLFDNGNTRPAAEGGQYSRALELELDFDTMTAHKVWEYRHSPDIFSTCCSNVTRLENGNTVMVFGAGPAIGCCSSFSVVEADADGNTVAELLVGGPGKVIQYRAYPLDTIGGEHRKTP